MSFLIQKNFGNRLVTVLETNNKLEALQKAIELLDGTPENIGVQIQEVGHVYTSTCFGGNVILNTQVLRAVEEKTIHCRICGNDWPSADSDGNVCGTCAAGNE